MSKERKMLKAVCKALKRTSKSDPLYGERLALKSAILKGIMFG